MSEKMELTKDEKKDLKTTSSEEEWYKVCDQIKIRRNGQYPPYLSRQILELYQQKFITQSNK